MNDGNVALAMRVECYSGYRGEQSPRSFYLGDSRVEVEEIIDRWLSPERRYFKVRCDDGGVYILCHDVSFGRWEMTLYARSELRSWPRLDPRRPHH